MFRAGAGVAAGASVTSPKEVCLISQRGRGRDRGGEPVLQLFLIIGLVDRAGQYVAAQVTCRRQSLFGAGIQPRWTEKLNFLATRGH